MVNGQNVDEFDENELNMPSSARENTKKQSFLKHMQIFKQKSLFTNMYIQKHCYKNSPCNHKALLSCQCCNNISLVHWLFILSSKQSWQFCCRSVLFSFCQRIYTHNIINVTLDFNIVVEIMNDWNKASFIS